MTKANIERKLRCPHCGNTLFYKREGFHLFRKYKCHSCDKNFSKPVFMPMPSKDYVYMQNRMGELEAKMDRLLKEHGWAESVEKLYSYIPSYITYYSDWE